MQIIYVLSKDINSESDKEFSYDYLADTIHFLWNLEVFRSGSKITSLLSLIKLYKDIFYVYIFFLFCVITYLEYSDHVTSLPLRFRKRQLMVN